MSVTIVVIGKPGSGKTTFIQRLSLKIQNETELQSQIFNDRDILLEMAHKSDFHDLIKATDEINFEVFDEGVYDVAIDQLISKLNSINTENVSLVEFSRNQYLRVFERFGDYFSKERSVAVYLDTGLATCKHRNKLRDHSVPDKEMDEYFSIDDVEDLISAYPGQVLRVNNELTKGDLDERIEEVWPNLLHALTKNN